MMMILFSMLERLRLKKGAEKRKVLSHDLSISKALNEFPNSPHCHEDYSLP